MTLLIGGDVQLLVDLINNALLQVSLDLELLSAVSGPLVTDISSEYTFQSTMAQLNAWRHSISSHSLLPTVSVGKNIITNVCNKANTRSHYLKLLNRCFASVEDLLQYYKSVIRPAIEYACMPFLAVWTHWWATRPGWFVTAARN